MKTRWTPKELQQVKFPELDWIVPKMLPEGFSILGGRPKVGKSWLAMQISLAVITGGRVFNESVKRGKVLYLALEDNPRRLARRMSQQGWPRTSDCVFLTEWKPLNEGGLDDLKREFEDDEYRLCIVDTVSRAFRLKDHNDLGAMTKAYDAVQKFFDKVGVNLLCVDHHSKAGTGDYFDPIDSIIASTAKVAVPDTIIGLAKRRGQRETRICAVGREMEEFDTQIYFDGATVSWQLAVVDGVKRGTLQEKIIQFAADQQKPVYIGEIAKTVGRSPAQVSKEINELVTKGWFTPGVKQGTFTPFILKRNLPHD